MAFRLSEGGKHTVAVLEYGGNDNSIFVQMPAALSYPMNMKTYNWGYQTNPEPYLDNRVLNCPRGKVIGGSSSINGMVYVRGNPGDYNYWEESGATGWGYSDILPYFKRMENSHGGEEHWRGTNGPLHVKRAVQKNPINNAFMNAVVEAGYTSTEDYNGYRQEGFSAGDMTVWQGRRWSSANAYLKPALKNKNLTLFKNALVDKIIISEKTAKGVSFFQGRKLKKIYANREVICSAGSINTPQIMQRSGIGPAELLKKCNIEIVKDSTGVGENLQDHLEVYLQVNCKQPISLYKNLNLFSKGLIGLQWLLFKNGHGATNHFETLGFIRSKENISYPDIMFHLLPIAINYDGSSPVKGHGFQLHVGPMRSKSRGFVKIRSAEASESPEIQFNYMSHESDWEEFRRCIRLSREILSQPALSSLAGKEIQPGNEKVSDHEIDEFIKQHAESAYHPCGTMRMGAKNDPNAVIDPECRVIGIRNLRVADSSIFPRITNGNLNAPSIMVGEKAADHILGVTPLPRSNQEPYESPDWSTKQR